MIYNIIIQSCLSTSYKNKSVKTAVFFFFKLVAERWKVGDPFIFKSSLIHVLLSFLIEH